MPYKPTTL